MKAVHESRACHTRHSRSAAEITLGDSALSVWSRSDVLPRHRIALLEAETEVFIITRSLSSFEKMLRLTRPDLSDVELIGRLLRKAAPSNRVPLVERESPHILPKYRAIWHPPSLEEGRLVLFCNDFKKGKFEQVTIDSDYLVEVDVLGLGKKAALR
jgi:hypothetical protein